MLSNYLAYFSGSSKMFDKYQMPLVVREFATITLPYKVNFLLLQILRITLNVLNFWYPFICRNIYVAKRQTQYLIYFHCSILYQEALLLVHKFTH